jgi:hypothetical protein
MLEEMNDKVNKLEQHTNTDLFDNIDLKNDNLKTTDFNIF